MKKGIKIGLIILTLIACESTEERSDAYGNFEATSTIISSEANGKLLYLDVVEGETIPEGQLVGLVDTIQLDLQKKQMQASLSILPKKLQNNLAEIEVLKEKKVNITRERDRVNRLLQKKAATAQQLDNLNGQIDVIDQQILAIKSKTSTANTSILSEKEPILAGIALINEQLRKSFIYNPIKGTIINKLAEPHEIVRAGSPLYQIAALDTLTLKFYVDAIQLEHISLAQELDILTDSGIDSLKLTKGTISWISDIAEFTPKTIQTREDRVNLVYAVKALVPNKDGKLKIGMPAEIIFRANENRR